MRERKRRVVRGLKWTKDNDSPHGSLVFGSLLRKELISVGVPASHVSSLMICSLKSVTSSSSCKQTFNT